MFYSSKTFVKLIKTLNKHRIVFRFGKSTDHHSLFDFKQEQEQQQEQCIEFETLFLFYDF